MLHQGASQSATRENSPPSSVKTEARVHEAIQDSDWTADADFNWLDWLDRQQPCCPIQSPFPSRFFFFGA